MKKQYITITLDEYKELRAIIEEYNTLVGEYNLLKLMYDLKLHPEPKEQPKKNNKIGF